MKGNLGGKKREGIKEDTLFPSLFFLFIILLARVTQGNCYSQYSLHRHYLLKIHRQKSLFTEVNKSIQVAYCPSDITLNSDGYGGAVVRWEEPQFVAEKKDTRIDYYPSKRAGTRFQVGKTFVSYLAKDDFGNTAWCNFTVTVLECKLIFS